jgi:hypothetical protein
VPYPQNNEGISLLPNIHGGYLDCIHSRSTCQPYEVVTL